MRTEDYYSQQSAHSNYTSRPMVPKATTELINMAYHTIIFFACFPFFSESLWLRNSTSVARGPASLASDA